MGRRLQNNNKINTAFISFCERFYTKSHLEVCSTINLDLSSKLSSSLITFTEKNIMKNKMKKKEINAILYPLNFKTNFKLYSTSKEHFHPNADQKNGRNNDRENKEDSNDPEIKENENKSTRNKGFREELSTSKIPVEKTTGKKVPEGTTGRIQSMKKNGVKNENKKGEPRGTNLLIVGLGNPGSKYENTRHNAGFMVLDELAKRLSVSLKPQKSFEGEYGSTKLHGKSIGLLKPSTFMNLSGQSVRKVKEFYKLNVSAILIIVDDVNLDVGQIKLRQTGSAGGQNGLKNIEQQLKTKDYARIRVGIGQPQPGEMVEYVLSNFSRGEKSRLDEAIYDTLEAIEKWIVDDDIGKVMHAVNAPK